MKGPLAGVAVLVPLTPAAGATVLLRVSKHCARPRLVTKLSDNCQDIATDDKSRYTRHSKTDAAILSGSLIQPQISRKLECDASDGKSRYITADCRRGNSELPCVCSRFTLPGLEELTR